MSRVLVLCSYLVLAGGLASIVASAEPPALAAETATALTANALYIPPLLRPRMEGGTKVFTLAAREGTTRIGGELLDTAGFNGAYRAPTIRVARGDRVRIDVTNEMAEATTVHWHGLHVAARNDGGPYQPIPSGSTWSPAFTLMQQATTLWYHPHLMGQTAPQVGRGMAGMFIIDDATRASRSLPRDYGVNDIPVLLQGAPLPVGGGDGSRRPLLANGTPNAVFRTSQGRLRLRLLNATGGAMLGVSVEGARAVRVIGSDGGLLPAPVNQRAVVLGPSERSELLVDVAPGSRVRLRTTILSSGADASAVAARFLRGSRAEAETGTSLTIVSTARRLGAQRSFRRLNAAPALDLSKAVQREMVLGPGIEINGQLMLDMDHGPDMAGTLRIPLDQTEVWTIRNTSPFVHVFHVHDIEFQVLDRDGRTPVAVERGWKDSVHVYPGQVVRIAMQFTHFADPDHPYMFHCHVLRHEDAGMMGQFVVVDPSDERRVTL